jgi:hypothetical protein
MAAKIERFGGYTYDHRHAEDELRTLRHERDALRERVRKLETVVFKLHLGNALRKMEECQR